MSGLVRTKGLCRVSGKRRYASETAAKIVLTKLSHLHPALQEPGRKLPCRVYVCPFCKDWHLTSVPLRHPHPVPVESQPVKPAREKLKYPFALSNLLMKEAFDQLLFDYRHDESVCRLLTEAFADWKAHKSFSHPHTREVFKMVICTVYDEQTWLDSVGVRGYWLEPEQLAHPGQRRRGRESFPVRGLVEGRFSSFLGIPYARAGRFEYPEPVSLSDVPASFEALTPSPGCPQPRLRGNNAMASPDVFSEDCLRLSIYSPSMEPADDNWPVMVFFHGGSYLTGGADAAAYDPTVLAREHKVVVVKVNYRLGLLGFLGGTPGRPANLGLCDALLALEWVKKHIGSFGGNPRNVTVFGQSAGGDLIAKLLLVEGAEKLFRRAIIQSAPMNLTYGKERLVRHMLARTERVPLFAPAERWAREGRKYFVQNPLRFGVQGLLPLGCQFGYEPLPAVEDERTALARVAPHIEVLVGSMPVEASAVFLALPAAVQRLAVGALRPLLKVVTDGIYGASVRDFAQKYRSVGGRVICYRLETGGVGDPLASSHSSDLALLFEGSAWEGSPQARGWGSPEFREQAEALRLIWALFARTGRIAEQRCKTARFQVIPMRDRAPDRWGRLVKKTKRYAAWLAQLPGARP